MALDKTKLLEKLEKLYYGGARRVRYEDRELTMHDRAEVGAIIAQLKRELGLSSSMPRRRYISTDKDLT